METTLTDAQLDRYARHIVLPEIGGAGQKKLLAAHAVIIGAGGIGCPVIQYLAAVGVGHLTLVDDDRVALSNLQRQVLFGVDDIGTPKVEAAMREVAELAPDTLVTPLFERFSSANGKALLARADIVVDGCDNFESRLAVGDAALAARVPLVSASAAGFDGQLGLFRGWEADKPCYRCLVGDDPATAERSCADQGVLGALPGAIGGLAALEAIRSITDFGDDSAGKLLIYDGLAMRMRTLTLPKDPECSACGRP